VDVTVVRFSKHVKVRAEKCGAVVFDTLSEKVFVTNEAGADILRLIGEGLPPEEIPTALAREYSVGVESIATDVREFVAQLKSSGILIEGGQERLDA